MSREDKEIRSAPVSPRPTPGESDHEAGGEKVVVSCPPTQYNSPSLSRSPLLNNNKGDHDQQNPSKSKSPSRTLKLSLTPRFLTPIGSPVRRALRLTKFDPEDAWLPITESRNGNKYYAAFHTLCSGIGVQALVLPVAFTVLGWTWGIISLSMAFVWQLYTLWLLVQLHESTETEMRYSRYLQLSNATFGYKLSKLLALFPIIYLSIGTCVALVIIGGSTARTFFQIVCGPTCTAQTLTIVEWYLVFTCAAVVLSQLPNLNSIAGVSLVGAITAVGYCTLIWVVSVKEGRLPGVSYDPVRPKLEIGRVFSVLNALGIVAFAFRGHNLILEIQATVPSSEKHPSRVPMWKGVRVSYTIIAACLFPLAIGGYWAYGQLIPANGGMLVALYAFHSQDVSKFVLGLTSIFVIINSVSSFQIYGMPMFDEMESKYTRRMKKATPWWLRAVFRAIFGFFCFFIAVAIPFLGSLAGLIGGIALPVALAYPSFMWIKIKKPNMYSGMWCLNWALGLLGMSLSALLTAAGIYVIIDTGLTTNFFKPQ